MARYFSIPVAAFMWIALGILFSSGCTSTDRKVLPPDVLFRQAQQQYKIESYEDAAKDLTQLMEDSPDSKERVLAQLLLADVYFKLNQWEEAKFNYGKFVELYPTHRLAPKAAYFRAMTDFMQIDHASRDQTFTHNAREQFEKMIRDYPKSPYRKKAEARISECHEQLARNMMEIARFYHRTNSFQSAILRFKSILKEYPEQNFRDEALFLLGDSYLEEQNYEDARHYFRMLLREHPRSEYTQEARSRLRDIP